MAEGTAAIASGMARCVLAPEADASTKMGPHTTRLHADDGLGQWRHAAWYGEGSWTGRPAGGKGSIFQAMAFDGKAPHDGKGFDGANKGFDGKSTDGNGFATFLSNPPEGKGFDGKGSRPFSRQGFSGRKASGWQGL